MPDEQFDGHVEMIEMKAAMLSNTDSINKGDMHQKNDMIDQINNKAEVLEQSAVNGRPIGADGLSNL